MMSRNSLSCVVPSEKTVEAFKNYNFENCDVPEKYWGDYTHANFFMRYVIPIARREMKKIASNTIFSRETRRKRFGGMV